MSDDRRRAANQGTRRASRARAPTVVILDVFSSGLAIARRVMRLGGEVILISDERRPESHTRAAGRTYELPLRAAWITTLRDIARSSPEAIVIPCTDASCEFLLSYGAHLPPSLRLFERGSTAHRALMAKDSADAIARGADVRVPYTARLTTLEDLMRVAEEAPWPCVVKPVSAHVFRARFGAERTFLVRDVREAERRLSAPLAEGMPMLLSQYIPGGDSDVEEAVLVRRADGSTPIHFGVRKLRQIPPGFGETALGESAELPEATEMARRVLDAAGFVGVAGVEVKRDCHTGERWFLEANVRVPNQWGLGDACGVDATRRLLGVLAGEPVGPQPALRPGVRFVSVERDLPLLGRRLVAAPRRRWPAIAAEHMRPWIGAGERTLLSLRDPGPGLAFLRSSLAAQVAGDGQPDARPRAARAG